MLCSHDLIVHNRTTPFGLASADFQWMYQITWEVTERLFPTGQLNQTGFRCRVSGNNHVCQSTWSTPYAATCKKDDENEAANVNIHM